MKEQGKNSPDQTNEEEIGSLPEKEFTVMIVNLTPNIEIEWRKHKKRLTRTEKRGQTAEARTTILQPVEQKPHSQKDR